MQKRQLCLSTSQQQSQVRVSHLLWVSHLLLCLKKLGLSAKLTSLTHLTHSNHSLTLVQREQRGQERSAPPCASAQWSGELHRPYLPQEQSHSGPTGGSVSSAGTHILSVQLLLTAGALRAQHIATEETQGRVLPVIV